MIDPITSAGALFAELGLGKALVSLGIKEGFDKLKKASAPKSPYREQLFQVVQQLLDEYRAEYADPLPSKKFYFWESRWALEWVMSYRFYSANRTLQVADIPTDLEYMLPPTQAELDEFSGRANELLDASDKLRRLYAGENLPVETFRANARAEEQRNDANEYLSDIKQTLNGLVTRAAEPDGDAKARRVRSGFEEISLGLVGADNSIPNLGIHLDREETQDLLRWLATPLQARQEPLAILEGGAGLGKTVIMQDVLVALQAQGTATLALKADRLAEPTYAQLTQRILQGTGFSDLGEALEVARTESETLVVLVDQLDALSQSLSANREALSSYRELIQYLLKQPGVRVLISCRTFDLETDPLLQTYTGKKRFRVQPLSEEQVATVVAASPFAALALTPALAALLRVPLHLRILCQLGSGTDLGGITTLQALYDELYTQRVLRIAAPAGQAGPATPSSDNLRLLLVELAEVMHKTQRLSASALRYQRKYPNEEIYALSQNLITRTKTGQLQFFHQSFFDYLFARNFVESGQQLTELLSGIHQGLFIRSTVSQVLQYLRSFDSQEHLRTVRGLLLHPTEYRLHLRLLVFQQFGLVEEPTSAEQHLAKQLLATAESRAYFLESVRSPGWAKWLVGQGVVDEVVRRSGELTNSEQNLLWYLARQQASLVLAVLQTVHQDEHTEPRAAWMLSLANETEDAAFEPIFARFAAYMEANSSWYLWSTLASRANKAPEVMAEHLFELLKSETWFTVGDAPRRNVDGSQAKQAVDNILQAAPNVGFTLLKTLLEHWVDDKRFGQSEEGAFAMDGSSIIGDSEFSMHEPGGDHAHGLTAELYDLAQQHLETTARQDPALARQLLGDWPVSPMRSLLQLTAATYLGNPLAFVDDVFALLTRPNLLRDAFLRDHLNFYLRELIAKCYAQFTPDQQAVFHQMVLGTDTKLVWAGAEEAWDRTAERPTRRLFTAYGELTYGYLSAIPAVLTTTDAAVKRRYQELRRRYGAVNNKAPEGMRIRSGHPSPLVADKAEIMQPVNWLAAFRQYQKPTGAFPIDDFGPGLAQHFQEQVKTNPARMMPVVEMLLDPENRDIPGGYLRHGLAGLAASDESDIEQLTRLILAGIDNEQINPLEIEGLRLLEKCVVDGRADKRVMNFLAEAAVAHRHDARAMTGAGVDELMDGINTAGGHAVQGLIRCYQMKDQIELIAETLAQVAHDGSPSVRAAAIVDLQVLLNLFRPEKEPVLRLLLQLIGSHIRLVRFAGQPLRFLIEDYLSELGPLFTAALDEPSCHERIAQTLTVAWAWDIPGVYDYLEAYWQHSPKAAEATLRLLFHDYQKLSSLQKVKAQQAFQELMLREDSEIEKTLEHIFHWLKADDFSTWLPLVRKYIAAPAGRSRNRAFYSFLQLCVQDYPEECIELAAEFDSHANPDIQRNTLDKKPLELLLSAYHVLTEIDTDSPNLEVAMNTFDRMLGLPAYRSGATEALALVDR